MSGSANLSRGGWALPLLLVPLLLVPPGDSLADSVFSPNVTPDLNVLRSRGAIDIDGEIGDPGWRGAARAGHFIETSPGDLVPPPFQTEVLVTYDDDHLYLAFIAADDPEQVRATLCDRDAIFQDDYVGLILDTYGDQSWAYEFFINPLGLQGDLRLTTTAGEDMGFDLVWDSRGMITDEGWQVEVAIPFASLRFPDTPEQEWRATFWRDRKRDFRERSSWAAIARDDACFLCQFGTLKGIRGVKPGNKLELLPSLVGYQTGQLSDMDDAASAFETNDARGELSLGMNYAFTPSLNLEATINPDFSQVESDAAQIDVNTTFALFYPERRPFFQRGSDLFNGWINAIYTRSINNPYFAGKLSGRVGDYSFLYLSAFDDDTPFILPFEERSEFVGGQESVSNIFRAKRNYDGGHFVGLLFANRLSDGDGVGTVGGVDVLYRYRNIYNFELQVLGSSTVEPDRPEMTEDLEDLTFDDGKYTAAFDGEDYLGHGMYASIERSGRLWSFDVDYTDYSPTFRAETGFINANSRRAVESWTAWNYRMDNEFVQSVFPLLILGGVWNYEGVRKDFWFMPRLEFELVKQTRLEMGALVSEELYQGIEFDGIRRGEFMIHSAFSEMLQIGAELEFGRSIARFADPPVLGHFYEWNAWATIKPLQQMTVSPEFTYARMTHPETDEVLYSGFILRARGNYQFTRRTFMRLVLQYDDFDGEISVEPLLSYKINPFTVFYAGSNQRFEDYGESYGFTESDRQYFIKVQYLFQS
jgi:hypothetical protein